MNEAIVFNSTQLHYELYPYFIDEEEKNYLLSSCKWSMHILEGEKYHGILCDIFDKIKEILPDVKYLGINTKNIATPSAWLFAEDCKILFKHKSRDLKYKITLREKELLVIYPETNWNITILENVCLLQSY